MSEKELLYIEDVLGHLAHLCIIYDDYINAISNPKLRSLLEKLEKENYKMEEKFITLLGDAKQNG